VFITLFSLMGALLTYTTHRHSLISTIQASSGLTLICYFILTMSPFAPDYYAAIFFGGSFVGMTAPHKLGYVGVASAAITFSLMFVGVIPYISTFGGALGCSAFIAVCAIQAIALAYRKYLGTPLDAPK